MDQSRKQKIWSEIIETAKKENLSRGENEYTVSEFVDQIKNSGGPELKRDKARSILEKLVKDGVLKKRRVYVFEYRTVCALYSPDESKV